MPSSRRQQRLEDSPHCRLSQADGGVDDVSDVMFEQIGKTYIDYLEVDEEIAQRYLDRALNNVEISENQYNKIKMLCNRLNTITIG